MFSVPLRTRLQEDYKLNIKYFIDIFLFQINKTIFSLCCTAINYFSKPTKNWDKTGNIVYFDFSFAFNKVQLVLFYKKLRHHSSTVGDCTISASLHSVHLSYPIHLRVLSSSKILCSCEMYCDGQEAEYKDMVCYKLA